MIEGFYAVSRWLVRHELLRITYEKGPSFCRLTHWQKSKICPLLMSGIAAFVVITFLHENYRKQIIAQEASDMRQRLFRRSKFLGESNLDYHRCLVNDCKALAVHIIELGGVAEVHREVNGCLECYTFYST